MTEHDGLTAEQEAVASSPTYCAYCNAEYRVDDDIALIQAHIYQCPEHPLPKALARAEAAEARVAVLERVIRMYVAAHDVLTDTRRIAEWGAWEDQECDTMKAMRSLTAPTTEAVTEVEEA